MIDPDGEPFRRPGITARDTDSTTMPDIDEKMQALKRALRATGGLAVAFSGGVDSTFLAANMLKVVDGGHMLPVTNAGLTAKFILDAAEQMRNQRGALATRA